MLPTHTHTHTHTAPDKILVVIARTRHKMVQAELQAASDRGAGFVELRLDFLAKAVDFKRLAPFKKCPWVATIRRPAEGGRWPGTEPERLAVLRQAIASGVFDWVDLETDIADGIPRFGAVKRIVSYHNTAEAPADLDGIYARMLAQTADVLKIAVAPQIPADNRRILELQTTAPKPTVAFGMGDLGFPTRLLALKLGAPWAYAAFNRERGVAPGLPSFDDLLGTYPARRIGPATKVFGLLGDPVGHSLGPVLHNRTYRKLGIDAVYLPVRLPKGQMAAGVEALGGVPVDGYSVTIPHKEAAARLAGEGADATVMTTGAANTMVRRPDGTFAGYNTDLPAVVGSLVDHLRARPDADGPPPELPQLFVLVLGSGGVARSVAHGLAAAGAHLTVSGRSAEAAGKLAADVGCKVVDWEARHNVICDVVVNATSVGMAPNVTEMPIHMSFLKPGMTVFDTVYTPENTMLVREARERGCHVVTGVDMFVRQAARQIELFTGAAPPLDELRELMRKAMSPVRGTLDDEGE